MAVEKSRILCYDNNCGQKQFYRLLGTYSQNLIFLLTDEIGPISQCYTRLKKFSNDKHSSLLGTFVSYEENEVRILNTAPGSIF